MGSSMWGIGYSVVWSRKARLLRRFVATPMRKSHFLLSYILSRMVFLILEVAALIVFGVLAFDVHVHGSWLDLSLLSLLGSMSFAGVSLLIAARVQSLEAAGGWMNFVMMPMWLASGSFFSYERFPEFLHPFIRALPLTAINDGMRRVVNDGLSLASASTEILILVAWGIVSFALALKFFRWQ
jgi:ABC-type multidrug transport system permease subunit